MKTILKSIVSVGLMLGGQFQIGQRAFTAGSAPYNACLVSGWPMTEGTGLTLNDVSANGNTMTVNTSGAIAWGSYAGLTGTTPRWLGAGYGLASSTSDTNFSGTSAFSLALWMYPIATTEQTLIGDLNTSSNYQGWELELQNYGSITNVMEPNFFLINSYPSNFIQVHATTTPLLTSTANFIVLTYTGSQNASGVDLYVNGVSQSTTVQDNTLSATTASGLAARAAARSDGSDELSGPMAYVAVYNCVLTPTEVTSYYAAGPRIN